MLESWLENLANTRVFGSHYKCLEGLSPSEHNELLGAAWFQAGIPRDISLEVLDRQSPGAFIVRRSTTKPDCFALSLRVPPPAPKVAHYLILRTIKGFKIKVMFLELFRIQSFFFLDIFLFYIHFVLRLKIGIYKGIFNIESIDHTSLSYAWAIASDIIIAKTAKRKFAR